MKTKEMLSSSSSSSSSKVRMEEEEGEDGESQTTSGEILGLEVVTWIKQAWFGWENDLSVLRAEFSRKVRFKFDYSICGSRSELRAQSETRRLKNNLLSSDPVVEFECLCMTEPR